MLITTDLHLTDRPRDEYRWEVLDWIAGLLAEGSHEELLILGDLTDAKDGHSAALVNRIVSWIADLPVDRVVILKGNHDYVDASCPFFRFLNELEGVDFIVEPTRLDLSIGSTILLPHERRPLEAWPDLKFAGKSAWSEWNAAVFCHQTFDGARGSNGYELQGGIGARFFSEAGFEGSVFSGDIHVPQRCGDVEYVGTPYPVAFGDSFDPRILDVWFDDEMDRVEWGETKVPTIRKLSLTIDDPSELAGAIREGDQVKLTLRLGREDFVGFDELQGTAQALVQAAGGTVHAVELVERAARAPRTRQEATKRPEASLTALETFKAFTEARGISEAECFAAEDVLDALDPAWRTS